MDHKIEYQCIEIQFLLICIQTYAYIPKYNEATRQLVCVLVKRNDY